MTFEEFLDWADEDILAEWANGEVVMTSPASRRHQDTAKFLLTTLSAFVDMHDLGTVMGAPFVMRLPTSGRKPDVLYIARAHEDRVWETLLAGPADLIIEIVSPESIERDRVRKFAEYQAGGVAEYWLLDPGEEQADFYQLGRRGRYRRVPADRNGVYHSRAVPGFWLRVPWLWRRPLPDPTSVLPRIDRDAYARYLQEKLRQAGL